MGQYILNKNEKKDIKDIVNTYYMQPILKRIDKELSSKKHKIEVFNELYNLSLIHI